MGLSNLRWLTLLAMVAATPLAAQTAPAQSSAVVSAEDKAAYEAAFQASLAKPADPDTLVKFAAAAVKIGDLEGAISALERMLLIDGDNPDIQLELGVLYFRLGSLEAARSYLTAVRDSQRASAETKARAVSFLREARSP